MKPDQYQELKKMIQDLAAKQALDIREHEHDGLGSRINDLDTDIQGLFETVSVVPTNLPKGAYDQIKVYENAGTHRLYWYDATSHAWRYTAGT